MAVQYLCCTLLHTHSIATIGPFIAFHFWLQIYIVYPFVLIVSISKLWASSMHNHSFVHTNKKSMYKNTVMLYSCRGNGSMYWSDKDITRGEKRNPCPNRQPDSTYRWQREYVEYLWAACLRCLFNHWTDFKWLRPESVLLTVGWVM